MGLKLTPIAELGDRMAEQGRLRFGVKTGKAMKAIKQWRLTSPDKVAIEQAAELYGGTPRAWSDPKASPPHQFEVLTESDELTVWLPPDPLLVTYEKWGGRGCERRCDGVSYEAMLQSGPEDFDQTMVPCACVAAGAMECKPYTRLSVVLPDVRFGGTWRMETKGWMAAHEFPPMVALITTLQARPGETTVAVLKLVERQSRGGSRKYVVPQLITNDTPLQIASGQTAHRAITSGGPTSAVAALGPGVEDDEVELVDDELMAKLSGCLDLDGAPPLDGWGLLEEWGDDALRKADGLLSGRAKWGPNATVVKA